MSAQLWASKVCMAGLLAKASCTAPFMLSGAANNSLLSLSRSWACCGLRLNSSLPSVKELVASLVCERVCSKLTEAHPVNTAMAAAIAAHLEMGFMCRPVMVCRARRVGWVLPHPLYHQQLQVFEAFEACAAFALAVQPLWRTLASRRYGQYCHWRLSN